MEEIYEIEEKQEISLNPARVAAVRILHRFERSDAYIDKLLNNELSNNNLNKFDKSLLTELVNGVIRWRWKLDWGLTGFYHGDYLKCLNIVKNSMRVALYQIMFLNKIPAHAAINDAVEIVKRIQGEKTAGIVNGVLRNLSRNLENIRYPELNEDPVYYYNIVQSHPRWMVKRWADRFGEEALVQLLEANNRKPYVPIRVNTLKATADEIYDYLNKNEILFKPSNYVKESLIIRSPGLDISELDIFKDGKITIQDPSAIYPVMLANPQAGEKIIDICAAPGGKSFYLAELSADHANILAVDKYKNKLSVIEESAKRLGITSIQTDCGDAVGYKVEEPVDLVFADVPCSGLGVISKKPDIKWKREREDIIEMAALQKQILVNATQLVKVGGRIVYSTCTIEPEENEDNISWFLTNFPNFELEPAENFVQAPVCENGFYQTFPHKHFIDGAFAARLKRID